MNNFPLVSIIIVVYNNKAWLNKCFNSILQQTVFPLCEIIFVDNGSKDGSIEICKELARENKNTFFLQSDNNLGFGGGCNYCDSLSDGKFLFFISPDIWLELDCIEKLIKSESSICSPLVLNYENNNIQCAGNKKFKWFDFSLGSNKKILKNPVFTFATFLFIKKDLFYKIGKFDDKFFLYGEELDISWRANITGEKINIVNNAKLHHEGISSNGKISADKRFYANRNHLITILKNSKNILLFSIFTSIFRMTIEALAGTILTKDISFIKKSLFNPIKECFCLREYILTERKRIDIFRQRNDFWILKNFTL